MGIIKNSYKVNTIKKNTAKTKVVFMNNKKIPWINKKDQPEYSNDIFPTDFLKYDLDDSTDTPVETKNNFYYNHDNYTKENLTSQ